ncbi:MAG: DNA repair protein RecN [Deltaproteobacteria bacterium]|nr:MAG: DNA repair protein RecN [Deltaproteobacteria bacterium]
MLRHLRVTNFAILSDVSLDFSDGFNVLTGETGAGKSLIVEAVNLLRGGRASADIPRKGADEAVVEAIVEVPDDLAPRVDALVDAAGLPREPELLIRRVVQRGGRSRTYVNGALTTASRLADIASVLIDLSGQHQHQGLVDANRHRDILDAFAGHDELVARMRAAYAALADADRALAALSGDAASIEERMDYLRFQVDEIDAVAPVPGEDEELERERARLHAVDQLLAGARGAEELAYSGDGAAIDQLAAAIAALSRAAAVDDALDAPRQQLEEARALIEDAAATLRDYAETLDADPARLAEVEDRLEALARLKRKHGPTLDDVLARAGELRAELDALANRDGECARLERERQRARAEAEAIARELTAARRKAGRRLARAVGDALAQLGMADAALDVQIAPRDLGPAGGDRVELRLAANPGEEAKPLAKVASGGELSRIMLALKLVLRRAEPVATYVFDEVDAGIGGATAEVVGRQIRQIANARQVLCVTHLAQIAAFADTHFRVSKQIVDGRTETEVVRLDGAARTEEISRMLSGARLTRRARAHAEELLRAARGA